MQNVNRNASQRNSIVKSNLSPNITRNNSIKADFLSSQKSLPGMFFSVEISEVIIHDYDKTSMIIMI